MRSIRFSLILCILVLLVLSLVTVSGLAYREAQISLDARKGSMCQFLKAQNEELRRSEEEKLDESLLNDAKIIANAVRIQIENPKFDSRNRALFSLSAMPAALIPQGHLFVPSLVLQGLPDKGKKESLRDIIWNLNWKMNIVQKIQDIRPLHEEANNSQSKYFQINTVTGDEWRSPSMGDFSFSFDPASFSSEVTNKPTPLVDWTFDNVTLKSETEDRAVRLVRAKFTRLSVSFPWYKSSKFKSSTPPAGKENPSSAPPLSSPSYTIFIQAATDLEPLEKMLAQYKAENLQELAELERQSQETLADLRNRLFLISGGTLLAAMLGLFLVVGWGLRPLRRLSDAVSKVSERDFRLPVEGKSLPSELRPIASRLEYTLDQLRRAFAREKQAAADISHELRTPLAAMLTTVDVALRKPRAAEEYHEILEECREAAVQVSQLVERMLSLARLDAGADHLRPAEVDVARLANQCGSLVKPLAEARGLRLKVEHNGPACINADPDKLREVLTNLLHNAIEYNKPNGSIDVSVHRVNGCLEMQVRDTGIGISPEAREHIFERFYREDPSRQAEGLHAGIGLALVKGYVDLMGGQIQVESTVGVGSTFTIRLPVRDQENCQIQAASGFPRRLLVREQETS